MTTLGYTDRVSVFPGDTLKVMVSSDGAAKYRADLVKLIHGDTNPDGPGFKEKEIKSLGEYPAKHKNVHSGSYVVVPDDERLQLADKFAVQAYICPTTPALAAKGELKWCSGTGWCHFADGVSKGPQGVLTKWDGRNNTGWALVTDESGSAALWLGDGKGKVEKVSAGAAMVAGTWYFVSAVYDGGKVRVEQTPVITLANGRCADPYPIVDQTSATVEKKVGVKPSGAPGIPLLMAGWYNGVENGKVVTDGKYNGKIDSPRVTRRALAQSEMDAPRGAEVIAAWDFEATCVPSGPKKGFWSQKVVDNSANGLHGKLVNQPLLGVTGYNWTSEYVCYLQVSEQYGAIHFHDDDLHDCGWEVDFEFAVPDDLHSALYAVRLKAGAEEDWIPFYVRAKRGQEAKIAFLAPTASYMAYTNDHLTTNAALAELFIARTPVVGESDLFLAEHREYGLSTYDVHADGSGANYSSRLRPQVNMRPKYRHWLSPSLWQFNADLHLIDWLTEMGYDFDVVTDEELNYEGVDAIKPYNVILTGTHNEYYSRQMMDATYEYENQGGRLMYMGANGYYWVISYNPEDPNIIETRKGDGSNGWKCQPGERFSSFCGEYGTLWRHRSLAPQKLTGTGFVAEGFDISSYYRRNPDSYDPRAAWMFDGIEDEILGDFGLVGDGAAGLELDIWANDLGSPPHGMVVASSENHTEIYLEVLEELFFNVPGAGGPDNIRVRADIVYYTTPNGGAVFSTSSIAFCGSLSHNNYKNNCSRLIKNVVDCFASDEAAPAALEA